MPYLSLLHPDPLSLWQRVGHDWATELIRMSRRWPLCIGPWIVYFFTGDEPCYLNCLPVPNKLFPIQLFLRKILKQIFSLEFSDPNILSHSVVTSSQFSSVQFSLSVVFDSLWPQGLQLSRLSWLSPTPGAFSSPCPLSQWRYPTISSSVIPFSSCFQSFPESGSFAVS